MIIERLKFPDGTPNGADVNDILKQHKESFIKIFQEMEWKNPFTDLAKQPIQSTNETEGAEWIIQDALFRNPMGYHVMKVNDEGIPSFNRLSNCVIDIHRAYTTEEGVEYLVQVGNSKIKSVFFTLPAQDFGEPAAFRKRLANHGAFHYWSSSTRILANISEYESSKDAVIPVNILDGFGWFPEHKFYAFPDLIIHDGKCYPAKEDGLIPVNGKTYKVVTGFKFLGGALPDIRIPEDDIIIEDLSNNLIQNACDLIGDGYYGLLALGWSVATFYSDQLFKKSLPWNLSRSFPYLHPIGKKGSGKTENTYRIHGLTGYEATGDSFEESTQDYLNKALYANRNLPMWFDEVRSGSRSKIRPGHLKTVYNRSASGKGTIKGTRSLDCNGCIILSGEERMNEIADRSVIIPFPHETERLDKNRKAFAWFTDNRRKLIAISIHIMKYRNKDTEKNFLDEIDLWIKRLKDSIHGISDRIAQNYAIPLAGLAFLPSYLNKVREFRDKGIGVFADWFSREMKTLLDTRKDSDIIARGFELYISKETPVFKRGDTLFIPKALLTKALARYNNFNEEQFMEALRSAPYYKTIGTGWQIPTMVREPSTGEWVTGEKKDTTRCVQLDSNHEALPEILKSDFYEI